MTLWPLLSPALAAACVLGSLVPIGLAGLSSTIVSARVMAVEWDWFELGSVSFGLPVLVDLFSLVFGLIVVVISFSIMLFSTSYMSGDETMEYFIVMVMLFVLSMNLLIFIPNLLVLLLGWDGLGLTSYLLVIYYQTDSSLGAGMITAMSNRIGDALLILAVAWSIGVGHLNFSFCIIGAFSLLSIAVAVAAMTNSAQIPFSAWLPAAMAAPTPVSSLVHSSTLVTAGVYLLVRFYPTLSLFWFFNGLILAVGALTCLVASIAANCEYDLKNIIALSTLSQLGVIIGALGLGQPFLAFFHLVAHALFKALLFVCAGSIIHTKGNSQDVRLIGALWVSMPVTCFSLNTANLALCGIPFMAGFYSKDIIIEILLMGGHQALISVMFIFSACLTSSYSVRLSILGLWSSSNGYPTAGSCDEGVINHISYAVLLTGAVAGGASIQWLVGPSYEIAVLPLSINLLTLTLISVFATLSFIAVSISWFLSGVSFISSIGFLSHISGPPVTNFSMSLGRLSMEAESGWMEWAGGGGALGIVNSFSKVLQSHMSLSFSRLTIVVFIGVLAVLLVVH